MTTYGDMKDRILADERPGDTGELPYIGLEILDAIAHYENQRWWFSEQRATSSTVASTAFVALPTDFIDEDSLLITVNGSRGPLQRRTASYIDEIDSGEHEGQPTVYAFYDGQIRLYPEPDDAYTLTFSYVKSQTVLSADVDENDWTNAGGTLIRERARASWKINRLKDQVAVNAATALASVGQDYLSAQEAQAYRALKKRSDAYTATGQIQPWCI